MVLDPKDKVDYYHQLKTLFTRYDFVVNPYRTIQYGLQFLVFKGKESVLLRIYDGKKGIRIDFSQSKNESLTQELSTIIDTHSHPITAPNPISKLYQKKQKGAQKRVTDPDELIGIDESGKGDYFGPLVISAVYTNPIITEILLPLGIKDSKTLSDPRVHVLAKVIKETTTHVIIVMGNESYNEVYDTMNNLNHMLAWGHAKVLEDTLKQVSCENALSDQFGDASLIENALIAKGIEVNLYQRHRAEDNIAVAAASILARDAFVTEIERYDKQFNMTFPKGCSDKTIQAAIQFCETYGKTQLGKVAKLHFKLTDQVAQALEPE
jgi:ribonuclease HIII